MKKKERPVPNCRLNQVGGQAVIEGVMMRHKERSSLAIRMPDGSIRVSDTITRSIREKYKILNIPIVRGVVNFIETIMLSMKTLTKSAEALGLEDEGETKFEKWLTKHFGKKLMDVVMGFAAVLGVALALVLFFFVPSLLTKLLDNLTGGVLGGWRTLIEGAVKILIFILYLFFASLQPDIKRTFQYHGAEHKSIFAYEAGVDLTPENAMKYKRFHPRCGTSFIFFMLLLSILIGSVLPWSNTVLRAVLKLLLLPLTMGLGYEFIMFAGKHSTNVIVRILSAPGLWMQRLTTKEPDASQLEVAIYALKSAMIHEFPDFKAPGTDEEKTDETAAEEPDTETDGNDESGDN
ncbi:MAG: DUF1385 domain-containing protein [Clostridia bacterium]|nr:DUF1385 domain-containing protein [Clostridia bacterium]